MPDRTESPTENNVIPLFAPNNPINRNFVLEAVRVLMRTLPLPNDNEPDQWTQRRMYGALVSLSALQPRDEIELMLGVQAVAAYHAAGTCFYLGMNSKMPRGDSTRHFTAGANAARTLDTLLKALERRQAKPLPPAHELPVRLTTGTPAEVVQSFNDEYIDADPPPPPPVEPVVLTEEQINEQAAIKRLERIARENAGLDIANTEGIMSCGGMIVPEDPTIQQKDYLERRLRILYMRELKENRAAGINKFPEYRPLRPGTYIP
jgi:hypothetical protein